MKLFFKKTTLSVLEKIGVLMKDFHIRPIQKIVYSFDPFAPNVLSCRYWPFPSVVINFRGLSEQVLQGGLPRVLCENLFSGSLEH